MAEATFIFWDVQHGSAAYIQTPNGKHLAVDLGTGSVKGGNAAFSPLLHLKRNYGVDRLDHLFVTHPHRDHLDDIGNLDKVPPRVFGRPRHLTEQDVRAGNQARDSSVIDAYFRWDRDYNSPVPPENDVFEPANLGGLELQSFTPTECPKSNLNNHSIVLVASYAGSKIIIPGDNEAPSWRELLESWDFRQAIVGTDVLVAPHHGREAGFSAELFDHITPRLVIVSDGPASSTSATNLYHQATDPQGWTVYKRSGGSEPRRVVTTRANGVVVVKFGIESTGQNYLNVKID